VRRLMGGALRRLAPRASAAVAVSRSVAADLRRVCGPGLRVEVVHNGIDLHHFSPAGPALDLDAAAGLPMAPTGTIRVGLVATLGVWKGHGVFLRALAGLPPGTPVRGYLVGGGIYRTAASQADPAALRRLAQGLGLEGRVGFTGQLDDPAAAMRGLDVVVHASTQPEPFGLVIAEAMGCGRALVASAAGGAAELVSDGDDALAVAPGDPAGLTRAISRLAGDAALRARLGVAGRRRAERDFDRARMGAAFARLYRELAGAA
jgi:glycosyltransferase involved in cell wall biosynthesis